MSRRVTIHDVAAAAGVSRQTVSRALNHKDDISEETRERVWQVIRRLGYRPSSIARGLVTQHTHTIGLVVPDIANPFFSYIARGAEDVLRAAGYSLLLCNTAEDPDLETQVLANLEDQQVDGIILCSSRLSSEQLIALHEREAHLVLVNRQVPGSPMASVRRDDVAGTGLAMRHLLAGGRCTIGLLAGPPLSYSARARERGYAEALSQAGLPLDPALTVACVPDLDAGRLAARRLLAARPDIDALICYNDLVAVGALQACAELGRRVPQDVAVIGYDDITLAAIASTPLTTLHVDQREMGALAAHHLLALIAGREGAGIATVLQPRLVVRASAP